ncbi:hypothetical protein ACJX0J_023307, partial [Zea mays]
MKMVLMEKEIRLGGFDVGYREIGFSLASHNGLGTIVFFQKDAYMLWWGKRDCRGNDSLASGFCLKAAAVTHDPQSEDEVVPDGEQEACCAFMPSGAEELKPTIQTAVVVIHKNKIL